MLRGKAWDSSRRERRPVVGRLSPLTAWRRRPWAEWRDFVRGLVAQMVADSVESRELRGEPPLPIGVGLADGSRERPNVSRRRSAGHVPTELKHSYNRIFLAKGEGAKHRLADAYAARRAGVDQALVAAEVLVIEGGGLGVELPEPCQWPPFATEALGDETWVELPFAEVFSGPLEAGPEPTATA